ncbi:hypothetical protein [Nocardia sp. IFM 10818]
MTTAPVDRSRCHHTRHAWIRCVVEDHAYLYTLAGLGLTLAEIADRLVATHLRELAAATDPAAVAAAVDATLRRRPELLTDGPARDQAIRHRTQQLHDLLDQAGQAYARGEYCLAHHHLTAIEFVDPRVDLTAFRAALHHRLTAAGDPLGAADPLAAIARHIGAGTVWRPVSGAARMLRHRTTAGEDLTLYDGDDPPPGCEPYPGRIVGRGLLGADRDRLNPAYRPYLTVTAAKTDTARAAATKFRHRLVKRYRDWQEAQPASPPRGAVHMTRTGSAG